MVAGSGCVDEVLLLLLFWLVLADGGVVVVEDVDGEVVELVLVVVLVE